MAQITLNSTGVASSGALVLQSNGTTTAVTVSTAQIATLVNDAVVNGLTIGRGAGAVATNTAVGASALVANTTGAENVAVGNRAIESNLTGTDNTAVGFRAARLTTVGNIAAFGAYALDANTTGTFNTAIGVSALQSNTTASNNTAVGYQAGYSNVGGTGCVYVGYQAGYANVQTGGTNNTFIGTGAGSAVTTGYAHSILGNYDGNQGGLDIRTASNYIVLSDGSGNPRFWHTNQGTYGYFVAPSIYQNTTASGANVHVTSAGELYRSTSSLKYKRDVQNATHGLAEVLQLRPVTYKGKGENDGETVFGGLIAEEVHEAGLTEFVQYAEDGSPDALAYGNMVSLCIKAIQELKAEFDAYKASHP